MMKWQQVQAMAGTMPTWKIADKMGVTENTIICYARRHGISLSHQKKQWRDKDNENLISLYEIGLTQREIGEVAGRTTGAVRLQIAKLRKEGLID